MPVLTPATIRKLSAYKLPDRNGYDLPPGPLDAAACWSWAVSGNYVHVNHVNSANTLYANVGNVNILVEPPVFVGFNNLSAQYGCVPEFGVLAAQQAAALGGNVGAQNLCKEALMTILATQYGLLPLGVGPSQYTLHMRSSLWYMWDHWAIGVQLAGGRRMIIQTVTDARLAYACTTIWDEGLPEMVLGIGALTQAHVDVINSIPKAPLMRGRCNCGATHGWAPSLRNVWHRCRLCGTVFCPTHAALLGGAMPGRDSRVCATGGCQGRTQVEPWDA